MKKQKISFILIIMGILSVAGIFTMKKISDVLPVFSEDDWL